MTGIVFLGPPGVGKGTQARRLAEYLGVPTISTGQIFRDNMAANTDLGAQARQYMDAGELVPDSITDPMVENRLAQPDVAGGFILDGYPRSLAQAQSLERMAHTNGFQIDLVIDIQAPRDVLVAHMLKRAGEENRADDSPEIFARRLEAYAQKTAPVTDYYRDRQVLAPVDGLGTILEVGERIVCVADSVGLLAGSDK